jgi:hypothetical protein
VAKPFCPPLGLSRRNANKALNLITKSLSSKSFADLIELNFMFVRVIADIAEAAVSHMEEESNGSR